MEKAFLNSCFVAFALVNPNAERCRLARSDTVDNERIDLFNEIHGPFGVCSESGGGKEGRQHATCTDEK